MEMLSQEDAAKLTLIQQVEWLRTGMPGRGEFGQKHGSMEGITGHITGPDQTGAEYNWSR